MKLLHVGICINPQPYNGLQKAFIKHSTEYREIFTGEPDLNKRVIELSNSFKPDLVFMQIQCAGVIDINTVKHLVDNGAYVINWNGDIRHETPEWMVELAPYVHTCFTNMRDVKFIRSLGFKSDWIEIGYDPEIYCPEGLVNTNIKPIVYFGNNSHSFPLSGFRNEMCDFLRKQYPGQFGEYGSGKNAIGNFNHSQREEAAAYRGAKIAINVSHFEEEQYTSDRLYRIMGTGVPLCLAKWYPGIKEQFDGSIITWTDLPNLKFLIDKFINYDEKAIKSYVNMGNAIVRNHYTFDKMVQNLINLWKNQKS